jgi:large subunit ribosomal protein L2
MGKNIIPQRRGRGTAVFKAISRRFIGRVMHPDMEQKTVNGSVIDLIKCPGHYAPVATLKYDNGEDGLMFAPEGMKVGDCISCGSDAEIKSGNINQLKNIPEGTMIYNIESRPGDGGKFCRSNGIFGRVVARAQDSVIILLPSKKERKFNPECRANIGIIAGSGRKEKPVLKAGNKYFAKKARNKFWPSVSASSMNAVDHPFGGGCSHRHKCPKQASRHAPPGRKVGSLAPRRTGRKR